MATIYGYSQEKGTVLLTMQASDNQKEINDKIEHLETYYPELEIEVRY